MSDDYNKLKSYLSNPFWRISHLYHIQNKSGRKIVFKPNWAQQELFDNAWYCNIILKARQIGISTYICMLFLDRCLFNPNKSAGIIAHTVDDAQQLFRKIKFAYDNLPIWLKSEITCDNDTAQMLKFSNGSSLRVGTSLRSSTFQYLHISEFGKICAKYPDKAEEIITGSLNTVAPGQYIFIESTAEGREGYFFDMCRRAQQNTNKLTQLDFKFHFFTWWRDPDYRIGSVISFDDQMSDYFLHLKGLGIELDDEQKWWYAKKNETQSENMRREYPSTPEEAWEQSTQGMYYAKQITLARVEKRIGNIPYDEALPVHTAWDLGFNDFTAIWFFQAYGKEIRLIDYMEGDGESLAAWIGKVLNKPYVYDKHLAPHDIMVREYSTGYSRQMTAQKLGIAFIPGAKADIIPGIDSARGILNRCWFDENKCSLGIKCLENYRKDWNETLGTWRNQPRHDQYSHGADAFRTLATGLHFVTNQSTQQKHNPHQYQANRFSQF